MRGLSALKGFIQRPIPATKDPKPSVTELVLVFDSCSANCSIELLGIELSLEGIMCSENINFGQINGTGGHFT